MLHTLKSQYNLAHYSTVKTIPGTQYVEKNINTSSFRISESGDFLLYPGDYSIPVMTYCMDSSSSSPAGHIYTLSHIEGTLAPIIRKLNLEAPSTFSASDIQIVHWSLLAGLSYDEMTEESQIIIDKIIPEYRDEFKESFLSSLEKKWNYLSENFIGTLPPLGQSIDQLGEMRAFREKIREVGHNYQELSRFIDTSPSDKKEIETSWSKISENIYARFVTESSFGGIGYIQVRVLAESGRVINSESQPKYSLDISSLIANPNDQNIQPLSFSPIFGVAGITATSQIIANPRAAVLLIALTLAIYPMNWDDFFKLEELLEEVNDKNIQNKIEKGKTTLRKEHDELEKPLKEAGIISGKDKKHSQEKKQIREYRKSGGVEQLEKDFEKSPGFLSKTKDGTEIKKLSDGSSIVKSLDSNHGPTLEVQPPKNDLKFPDNRIRIKVRYL